MASLASLPGERTTGGPLGAAPDLKMAGSQLHGELIFGLSPIRHISGEQLLAATAYSAHILEMANEKAGVCGRSQLLVASTAGSPCLFSFNVSLSQHCPGACGRISRGGVGERHAEVVEVDGNSITENLEEKQCPSALIKEGRLVWRELCNWIPCSKPRQIKSCEIAWDFLSHHAVEIFLNSSWVFLSSDST